MNFGENYRFPIHFCLFLGQCFQLEKRISYLIEISLDISSNTLNLILSTRSNTNRLLIGQFAPLGNRVLNCHPLAGPPFNLGWFLITRLLDRFTPSLASLSPDLAAILMLLKSFSGTLCQLSGIIPSRQIYSSLSTRIVVGGQRADSPGHDRCRLWCPPCMVWNEGVSLVKQLSLSSISILFRIHLNY